MVTFITFTLYSYDSNHYCLIFKKSGDRRPLVHLLILLLHRDSIFNYKNFKHGNDTNDDKGV